MDTLQRFFWWCAGADHNILKEHTTEHAKYFGIGGTIFFTALMASFAGGYAIYTAFQSQPLSIAFGFFWGCLIFNLDRYIVSSVGKGDGTTKITKDELINASPRLLMAILLGFVVATPLELKVFEKEISVEIQKMINEKREELGEGEKDVLKEIQRQKDRRSELLAEVDSLKGKISGKDPIISANESNKRQLDNASSELVTKITNAQAALAEERNEFNFADRQLKNEALTDDQRQDYNRKKNAAENKIVRLRGIISSNNQSLAQINKDISSADAAISATRTDLTQEVTVLRARNKHEVQRIDSTISQLEREIKDRKDMYKNIATQYNGFMAHMEALDRLSWRTIIEVNKPEASNISKDSTATNPPENATISQHKERTTVYWAKLLLTLMFIFIEIAPVLFKMMTEAGPYDDRMDEIKYASQLRAKKNISDMNEKTNIELLLSAGLNKNKIDAELLANEALLKAITEAQSSIARVAIASWKKQQLKQVGENPSLIINDIQTS